MNGRPADLQFANRGMEIHHGLDGRRRVEVERADNSRIVAERGGRGYIQRPYTFGGREFATGPTTLMAASMIVTMAVITLTGTMCITMRQSSITGRPSTDGRIIPGSYRFTLNGVGPASLGMDITATISRPIRCIRALRFG